MYIIDYCQATISVKMFFMLIGCYKNLGTNIQVTFDSEHERNPNKKTMNSILMNA